MAKRSGHVITYAIPQVLQFYKELPFNYHVSAEVEANMIRSRDSVSSAYPALTSLLRPETSILDIGCGTGWFSLSLRVHYGCKVTGIDFNPVAIERAREMSRLLKQTINFHSTDLFIYEPEQQFDLVVSLGVLHHTSNCHAGIERICSRFVKNGGHVFIGLYHEHGRRPFLDYFRSLKKQGLSEEAMFIQYRRLHSQLHDEVFARSWFRDQVLHPHETQHTLAEMLPLLKRCEMELTATSINDFEPIGDIAEVLAREEDFYAKGRRALQRGEYFPGFFVFLARKLSGAEGYRNA